MNQILSVENTKNKKPKSAIHSILIVFSVILIIFGIGLTSTGAYSYYRGLTSGLDKSIVSEGSTKPVITTERVNASTINIVVTHDKGIVSLTYSINDGQATEVNCDNKMEFKQEVELPIGSSKLTIIAKDINGISGIQKLNKIVQLNSMVGKNTTKAIAKENILLNSEEKVMEILKKEVRIINKDFKVSYNKVVAKAELSVKILYLTEEGKINYVEKIIPIMGFIDMENVTEENICELKYCMKNILVKLNNTDENSIYLEVEVEISCYSYETKDIELVQDVYTPFSNIQYKQKTVKAMVGLQNVSDIYQLKEQISDSEISNSRIYNVSMTSSINNVKIAGTKAIYEGEVSVNILYESTEVTRIDKKEFKFPINYELNILEGMSEENLDIMVDVEKYEISSQTDNIQINIDLNISTKMFKTIELNIIEDLEEKELEDKEEYSIIVYFVKAGDTLWNIAKKFRSTVENIKQINNIEDEDKLAINQQLFIPRYVEKVKAM